MKDEALKVAREALELEECDCDGGQCNRCYALAAIDTALEAEIVRMARELKALDTKTVETEEDNAERVRQACELSAHLAHAILTKKHKPASDWQPNYDYPRSGLDIVRSTLASNNVYLQGKNGDVYRVWLDGTGHPLIECVAYNANLPKAEASLQGKDVR